MDADRFDRLTRSLATPRSRRNVIKSLAASAIAATGLSRFGAVSAGPKGTSRCTQWCNQVFGDKSPKASDCVNAAAKGKGPCYDCGPAKPASSTRQLCGKICINACAASDQCHAAGVCNPATQSCTNPVKPNGSSCNDGNLCTQTDTCQSGVCVGSNPVVCTASDQCHEAGTCNPATGLCTNPAKPNGASCNDSNGCTVGDNCQSGTCVSGDPVTCQPLDGCHDAGTCNSATGLCTNPINAEFCAIAGACYSPGLNPANPCQTCDPSKSQTAWSPVCTTTVACMEATCDATTGTCGADRIQANHCLIAGQCVSTFTNFGLNPSNQCEQCRPDTSQTAWTVREEGAFCSINDNCIVSASCQGGFCRGTYRDCPDPDACHTATCLDNGHSTICIPHLKGGWCAISGTCVADETLDAANCRKCDASINSNGWTSTCATGETCCAGTCETTCSN
ncbi:MAG TPA: hypothetical protein VEQ36_05450 [Thermomicrobiales bacterium]|nr:hypothetical protein [Thermomicrobiales bacterium]